MVELVCSHCGRGESREKVRVVCSACAAKLSAQAQATADNSAMDATKLREAFMAGRLSQVCCIEQEQAFSEFMARRRHQ